MDAKKIINVHEAKAHLSKLLDRAHAGQHIVVSKKGKPWAKLVPIAAPAKRSLGFVEARVTEAFFESLPESELHAWE